MNYLIKYHVTSSIGALLKSGQVRVKNAISQKDALYEFNKMIRSKFTIPVNVQIESMETEIEPINSVEDFGKTFMDFLMSKK